MLARASNVQFYDDRGIVDKVNIWGGFGDPRSAMNVPIDKEKISTADDIVLVSTAIICSINKQCNMITGYKEWDRIGDADKINNNYHDAKTRQRQHDKKTTRTTTTMQLWRRWRWRRRRQSNAQYCDDCKRRRNIRNGENGSSSSSILYVLLLQYCYHYFIIITIYYQIILPLFCAYFLAATILSIVVL